MAGPRAGRRYLFFRVRAAFRAARERSVGVRFRAAERAWLASADRDAADRPSRRRAFEVAFDRVRDGALRRPELPFFVSRIACSRVSSEVLPSSGGGSSTPARRALERPIAMACLVERAPCLPSRT